MPNKMKKIFLLIFVSSLTTFTYSQKFHGGLFAGISASQLSGDQLSGFNKAGFYGGGFSNFYFTEKSALQLELYFIQKGSHKNQRPKNNDYTAYNINLQYVEMALLYQWHFSKRFYLETGPALGVILKTLATEKDENGIIPNYSRPRFNQFDLSVLAGLGFNISKHFKTNLRFENSVIPVRKPVVGTAFRLDRFQYNSTITLSLIYQI
jgi:hypothetical protein